MRNWYLFYRINAEKDTVACLFFYVISWCNFKIEINTFDLNTTPMPLVIKLHNKLASDWNLKYKK
jgi:hypothetical protein